MQFRVSQSSILWRQVVGLSAILAAVMFSWMAYSLYQPKILQELGFVKLAAWLGIIQGFLGAVLEPFVGSVSDQIQRRFGSHLPVITTGVTLAGLIFVAVAILLQWQIPVVIRPFVPVLMTLWVMSMIVFRGPVVALLRQAEPLAALPQANMLLTVVFGLVGALSPIMTGFLNSIGGSITFILGAISLTIGATILYTSTDRDVLFTNIEASKSFISLKTISIIFAIGLGVGIEINLLLRTFSKIIQHLSGIQANWIISGILLVSALTVVPAATLTTKLGAKLAMKLGMLIIVICLALLLFQLGSMLAIGLILFAGFGFGLVFESQIPLILGMVASDRAGLGTGLYFGGIGAAGALISILLQSVNAITPLNQLIWGAVSFLILILCLANNKISNLSDKS
ncbi:Major facilitator superfamily MFS_1 [Calothrix sp. PCC 7716]|nr:Major facilitator superfamily MFS_1 [Calothrix sp. PCC 7716]